jgi:ADP-ribose pyrophosphatase YjhB (NUDIX family)
MTRWARYCGVLAFHDDAVVLVREEYPTWGGEFWNVPSGRVEEHESPAQGAARELIEETGLVAAPEKLQLLSLVTTTHDEGESRSWNYGVEVASTTLLVDDPDGIIREARWFARGEAVELLSTLPYQPLAEPAVAFLSGRAPPVARWSYRR